MLVSRLFRTLAVVALMSVFVGGISPPARAQDVMSKEAVAALRASFIAEVHNVTNSSAGQSNYGLLTQGFASQAAFDAARKTTSYFGRVQEIVAPRVLKLGFKFDF